MIRYLMTIAVLAWTLSVPAVAQQATPGMARIEPAAAGVSRGWFGRTEFTVPLSAGVPFRVFTLDAPARLVIDFRGVDWTDVSPEDFGRGDDVLRNIRFGAYRPGWSRLVADLAEPALAENIAMQVDSDTGKALLRMELRPVGPDEFARRSGVPDSALWPKTADPATLPPVQDGTFVVVLDPGHGGIDPGAERDGVSEKELMLGFALELREILSAAGVRVVLTREQDVFVSLRNRVAIAHHAQADAFLSLHADALPEGNAHGATIYTLSEKASDAATAQLAARHNRTDVIAGADLTGSDDEVTGILLDLARQETEPRTEALANTLVRDMSRGGGPMNSRPLRRAGFSVLKSADIPSVLIEVGFLSSERDLANLRRPEWRRQMAQSIADALLTWQQTDAARRELVRR